MVPTYREAENLRQLSETIREVLDQQQIDYELLVVDDNSDDGTEAIAKELVAEGHPLRLIIRTEERDLSTAVLCGFDEATATTLLCMDADLSHPPSAIPSMLETIEQGAEFVIGSRYVAGGSTEEGWGLFRWLNSKVATLLARPFTSAKDPMAGFFALPRHVYERADTLSPLGYKIALELLVKSKVRQVEEVPIHFSDRARGQSKLNLKEQLNYLVHLKRLADYKFGNFSRLLQFSAVGTSGMVVDLGCYALMLKLGASIAFGRAVAIWIAMSWNLSLNRHVTFQESRSQNAWLQDPPIVASCLLGAILNWSTNWILVRHVEWFSNHLYVAALSGILVGTLSNFLISSDSVFGMKNISD